MMFHYDPILYTTFIICILLGLSQSYSNHKRNPAKGKYKPIVTIRL